MKKKLLPLLLTAAILFGGFAAYGEEIEGAAETGTPADETAYEAYGYGWIDPEVEWPEQEPRRALRAVLPASFDGRANQTPAKNQQSSGTCWAFAGIAAIEANAKLKGFDAALDLSERHAAHALSYDEGNGLGFDRGVNDGGESLMFGAYAMRGTLNGLVTEADDPQDMTSTGGSYTTFRARDLSVTQSKTPRYTVKNVYQITMSGYSQSVDMPYIKQAIIDYGAVTSHVNVANGWFGTNGTYYLKASENEAYKNNGHAVTLVGWDDAFAVENFPADHRPDEAGAWLVKNSWGANWGGNGGYLWISYSDCNIGKQACAFETVSDTDPVKKVYEYDPFGYRGASVMRETENYGANIFTAGSADEMLSEVKLYMPQQNVEAKIYLQTGVGGKDDLNVGKATQIATLRASFIGYYTVALDRRYQVSDKFAVIVHYGYEKAVPFEYNSSGNVSNFKANPGESFTSYGAGTNWTDTGAASVPKNVCVKAVTVPPDPISLLTIGGVTPPAAGEPPVTSVTETAQFTGAVTWSGSPVVFGSGKTYTATITLTPKPGYAAAGVAANAFTVTGAASVANGADSAVIVATYGATGYLPGDVNGDGVVDMADALRLLQGVMSGDLSDAERAAVDSFGGANSLANARKLLQNVLNPQKYPLR